MKQLLSFLFILFVTNAVLVQTVPQKMNYQAVARSADGTLISDKTVVLRIGITSSEIMNRPVYAEEHAVTTNKLGLFA